MAAATKIKPTAHHGAEAPLDIPFLTLPVRAPKAAPAPAAPKPALSASPGGKLGVLVGLLRQPGGAALADLMAATGWQAHSVRGAIAGALKKGRGLVIISEKTQAGRIYRIDAGAQA